MADLVKPTGNGLVNLLHHKGEKGLVLPKPFEREIFLFATHVAGTSHVEGMEELEQDIQQDEHLNFFREVDNINDTNAIVIKNINGKKIGYVPKADNVVFSRLMDAGKLLFGKVTKKEKKGKWVKIAIDIYLLD